MRLILAMALVGASILSAQEGRWEGALEIPGQAEVRIRVDLLRQGEEWIGTIDIPDQGVRNKSLAEITAAEGTVAFSMPDVPGVPRFKATLDEGGERMDGEMRQGGASIRFALTRDAAAKREDLGPNSAPAAKLSGVPGSGFEGVWLAAPETPLGPLRMLVRILRDGDGLAGTFTSPDQSPQAYKLDPVEANGARLTFRIPTVGGSFEGDLNGEGSRIAGAFSQRGGSLPTVFHRQDGEPDLARAQDPKRPYPYDEREVVYSNAGVRLAGTLTIPRGDGPFPAVVLISGSGAQDRDSTVAGHRLFLVLSDFLTRKGIAVLRSDDRGVGGSTGDSLQSTTREFGLDALAGVKLLAGLPEIDAGRIGLLGHSEGATAAAIAAAESEAVAFVLLMAGPGLPGDEILFSQARMLGQKMQTGEEAVAAHQAVQRAIFEAMESEEDDQLALTKIQAAIEEEAERLGVDQSPEALAQFKAQAAGVRPNRWLRTFLRLDPAEYVRGVRQPVLALYAELDMQVSPELNIPAVRAALSNNGDATIETLPGLNHLFQESESGMPQEYSSIEQTMSPRAMQRTAEWILQR